MRKSSRPSPCETHTSTHTHTHTHSHPHTHTHARTYIHTQVHTHTDTHAHTHKHTHTHTHMYVRTQIHTCMNMRMHISYKRLWLVDLWACLQHECMYFPHGRELLLFLLLLGSGDCVGGWGFPWQGLWWNCVRKANMTLFGQLVTGPPGSGKTTYCKGVCDFLRGFKRFVGSPLPAALCLYGGVVSMCFVVPS